jgi:hypothetical protein
MDDVLVVAPAAVLDLPFTYETTGTHTLRATFQNAGFNVTAALTFDAAGDLVGFVSADRSHGREGGPASWSSRFPDTARSRASACAHGAMRTGSNHLASERTAVSKYKAIRTTLRNSAEQLGVRNPSISP